MKRFEKAIKVLQDELYREAGRVAVSYVDNKHIDNPVELATRTAKVRNLKEAIKILEEHERNKNV